MLFVAEGDITLLRGDRIRCTTRISLPQRFGLPGEFDFPRFLAFNGVVALGRVSSQDEIVLIRSAAVDSLLRRADKAAHHLGDFIRLSVPDVQVSSILTALLIGDQKRIPVELAEAYTRAGVNHILSVSGFHVGIIAYFIVMIALLLVTSSERLALRFNLRRLVLVLTVPAMLLYLLLTGSAPATARSVIMLTVFVLALCAERETDPLNALLFSAFLLLAIHPPTLFDISFQLSFLALWGILVLVPLIMERCIHFKHTWQRSLLQFAVVSCAASIATLVPVLFIFKQDSLNGIVSNFLIVPLLGYGAVLTAFCAVPFMYLSAPFAHLLLGIAAKMVVLSNWLIEILARIPVIRFYGITALDMVMFLSVLCVLTFLRKTSTKVILCLALPLVSVTFHLCTSSAADGLLHVTMLSVGQAESLLVQLPDGATMLVDGGGYLHDNGRDFGKRTLAPALFTLGVRQLDYLVLTHSHPDHIGGLPFLVRTIPVQRFWETASGAGGEQYDQLRSVLGEKGVPTRVLAAGDLLPLSGGVTLQVLSPRRTDRKADVSADDMGMNEDSLVFRLVYGSFSMLFMADAGNTAEDRMLASKADLKATVLKVGHHGSRYSTSETFLKAVDPKAALISAGSGNRFGLPSPHTLSLLARHGVRTYRTDQDGTIEIASDGSTWNVTTPYRRQ
jgi:competence protein ComEC